MHPIFEPAGTPASSKAIPVWFATAAGWNAVAGSLDAPARAFAEASGYEPKPGRYLALPGAGGTLGGVLFGLENPGGPRDLFLPGSLAGLLPSGLYRFANAPHDARLAALAIALGAYRFMRYRKAEDRSIRLVVPDGVDADDLTRIAEGAALARDLINTPANDLGPAELEAAARTLGERHGARVSSVVGDDLIAAGFPMIHAVGRASARAPRLIDLAWGRADAPKVTLVGKGICFDTGGLDIKPASGMLHMKKDMGGAATALALGGMIMQLGIDVRLRVLIPAAEIMAAGESVGDPVWRMPFWKGYDKGLDSDVADMSNVSESPMAGSVIAALFLRRFVTRAKRFAHFDIYGWRPANGPLGPKGGEPQAARAALEVVERYYHSAGDRPRSKA
jgi:leucyl aminopeptidase